jgi:outer membrane protein OmpA-like peptidoglycan-associated protein
MHRFNTIRSFVPLSLLGLAIAACASARPSPMLVEARDAYDEARTGPANKYAPDLVYEARTKLEEAERAHQRDPGSDAEEHLAYLAHRRALLAMASADERVAHEEAAEARKQFETVLVTQRNEAMSSRSRFQEQFEQERQAREKAEEEARKAMQSLEEIASVKAEAQRVVITLSGEVLFKTGSATLLPIAQTRLDKVAEALKSQGERRMVVAGHTDSRGSDEVNRSLSQRRAEAVRSYLVSRGVPEDKVVAVGKGEVEPVADNKTAEGRANNRRVEIIVDNASGGDDASGPRGSTPSGGSTGGGSTGGGSKGGGAGSKTTPPPSR